MRKTNDCDKCKPQYHHRTKRASDNSTAELLENKKGDKDYNYNGNNGVCRNAWINGTQSFNGRGNTDCGRNKTIRNKCGTANYSRKNYPARFVPSHQRVQGKNTPLSFVICAQREVNIFESGDERQRPEHAR